LDVAIAELINYNQILCCPLISEDPHDAIHVLQKTVGLWQVRADAAVTEIKSKDLVNVEMKIEKNSR
jgi:hypothetical protein